MESNSVKITVLSALRELGRTGILIPLYLYPAPGAWDDIARAKTVYPAVPIIAVVNPANGPGNGPDPNYQKGIDLLKQVGITVVGYVSTDYARRDINLVVGDANKYKAFYGQLDGVFFDEMAAPGAEGYYKQANWSVKDIGYRFTIGNPGKDVPQSYLGIVDILVIYEGDGIPSLDSLSGWHTNYDKSNFAYIAYDVQVFPSELVTVSGYHTGWIYVSSDTLNNPFDSVPYLWQMLAALR